MVIRLRTGPIRIALAGLLMVGFVLALWTALQPWITRRILHQGPIDHTTGRALALDPSNDRIQAALATLYHYSLLLRDYPTALTAYRSVLYNNPLDSVSWLHLGKLYERLGRRSEADRAFRLAADLGPSNSALLWEIAVAYLEQEQTAESLSALTRFLTVTTTSTDLIRGYELARDLLSPDEVLNTVIPANMFHYTQYAHYLLDRNLSDHALAVWNRLTTLTAGAGESIDQRLQLRIIDLLIAAGTFDQAHQLWTSATQPTVLDTAQAEANPVSNASFEQHTTIGRGFDWRIGNAPGVVASLDPFKAHSGRQSLKLSFTKSRSEFSNVSQLVPVLPHSMYTLQAYMKTDGLTGPQGITIDVIDPVVGVLATTEAIEGTQDWTAVTATFRTSGTVGTVTLKVHHAPPPPYLPPRSGSVWIDNVSLIQQD